MKKKFNFNNFFSTISEKLISDNSLINNLQNLRKKILICKKKKKKNYYIWKWWKRGYCKSFCVRSH